MAEPSPLLVVLGATATGKTALAAGLAEALGGEVLSCDASCVYRGLDIGTAKPDPALRRRVPHHLLDVCEAGEDFSVAAWVELADAAIATLRTRARPVLIAGGTGLYLRALLQGLVESSPPDEGLRAQLEQREERRPGSLHRLLVRLDPASAGSIPAANRVRVIRALEHRIRTGRSLSEDQQDWSAPPRHASLKFGLRLSRNDRESRIRKRIDSMIEGGLIAEVRGLLEDGLSPEARSLRSIGYREALAHLEGRLSLDELRERVAVATRQYAKRQDTWFRREPGVKWLDAPADSEELPALIERVMMTLPRTHFSRERPSAPGGGLGKTE
jgi:tRNA dimethylallyltransferase